MDMTRLWQRNLGRDDRLVADTSRFAATHGRVLCAHVSSTGLAEAKCSLQSSGSQKPTL